MVRQRQHPPRWVAWLWTRDESNATAALSGDDMMAPGEAAAPSTSETGLVLVLIDLTREGQQAKCLAGAEETMAPGGDEAAAPVSALLRRSCLLR